MPSVAPNVSQNATSATESGVASGTALIMIGDDGDNYLSVAPGANYRLGRSHVDRARDVIAGAEMIVLQCEIPPDTLEYVIELAAAHRRRIMLNLAPARRLPDSCLQRLTYLILNESEAELLCGFAVDSHDKASEAGRAIWALGPEVVIVTLGAEGACVCAGAAPLDKEKRYKELETGLQNKAASVFTGEVNEYIENVRKIHEQKIDILNPDEGGDVLEFVLGAGNF